MDIGPNSDWPAKALRNFAPHKFVFRGVQCGSMEGPLQSLKFSSPGMQIHVCSLVGLEAKHMGRPKKWFKWQKLYWQGKAIDRHSDEYQELLDELFDCLFDQNENARKALLATQNAVLTHKIGKTKKSETVLTQQEFCSRLMKIRARLQAAPKQKR